MVDVKGRIKRVLDFSPNLDHLSSGKNSLIFIQAPVSNPDCGCTREQSANGDMWLARSTEHFSGRIYLNKRFSPMKFSQTRCTFRNPEIQVNFMESKFSEPSSAQTGNFMSHKCITKDFFLKIPILVKNSLCRVTLAWY